jgi:hypothetical protein
MRARWRGHLLALAALIGGATAAAVAGAPSQQPRVVALVIRPAALRLDRDVGGRCALWQRRNPGKSVWIWINQHAIPECTGRNGRPVVAQFCTFAVLSDGRRIKTTRSATGWYCEMLYNRWLKES